MKKIKYSIPFLFFILVYANQGFSSLPSQCIYYITRESWKLSATLLGLISFVTGFAWYVKPCIGYLADKYCQNKIKNPLIISYSILIGLSLCIIIFGLNLWSLIIVFTLSNFCIAFNDILNDKKMCKLEKKYNLGGSIQSLQWTSLSVAGLVVSILGAWIADKLDINIGYRIAYAITLIVPIITLVYLKFYFKEERYSKSTINLKNVWKSIKNKKFLFSLLFIACFQLSPSFGTPLFIKMREVMNIDKMFIGFLGATGTILGILGYILYYWKFHKFNITKLLYFTVFFSALTNLFYLYIPNQWYLLAYNILFSTIGGITFLVILAFYARITPNNAEGLIYALITSVSNLCGHLSSVFGGIIFDNFGYNWTVIISTIFTLACLWFIPHLKEKNV